MLKLSKHTYTHLIEGDIEWLGRQPNTLERQHIEVVLYDSIKRLYPESDDETLVKYSKAMVGASIRENEVDFDIEAPEMEYVMDTTGGEANYILGAELLTEERQERTAWCKFWCAANGMQFIKLTADGKKFNVIDPDVISAGYQFTQYDYQEEIGKYDQ